MPALIQEIESRPGDNPHTILTFHNAAGRLRSAPVWASEQHRIEHVARGQAVEVTGIISHWRDRPQLQLHSLRVLPPEEIAWDELQPSIGDPRPWWRVLDHARAAVRSARLAQTLALFFDEAHFRRRFERCPASLTGHHARLGGLLQHTCEVVHLTKVIAGLIPQANADLLLAGALLHDIGKLESYHWEGLFDTTVVGRVIGHVVLGARMLDRVARLGSSCLPEELDALQHLILSHHGRLEFGAPVLPLCLEAEILAHADLVSARTASFAEALANPELFRAKEQFSTRPVWEIDQRRLWKGIPDAGGEAQP